MPIMVQGGQATHLDWDSIEFKRRVSHGETYWGSMLGAALYGGVQASVFESTIRAVDVFDSQQIIENNWDVSNLTPIGQIAEYKIVHFNGKTYHHGLRRGDLAKEAA